MEDQAIPKLLQELSKLPGIGAKSAERILHYLLSSQIEEMLNLSAALRTVAEKVRPCKECHMQTEGGVCAICRDPKRDRSQLCVVEQSKDVLILERSATYRGLYHVLGGRLAPLENMGPEKLTLDSLVRRVRELPAKEVILATNPTLEGDGTALYISNLLAESGARITRLARGIPSGSMLDFANQQMLADAIEGRRAF